MHAYRWNIRDVNKSSLEYEFNMFQTLPNVVYGNGKNHQNLNNNFFQCPMLQTYPLAPDNVLNKLKHDSIINGYWDIHWNVHMLFQWVHTSVDISTCNTSARLRLNTFKDISVCCFHIFSFGSWKQIQQHAQKAHTSVKQVRSWNKKLTKVT